ncbi:MAG: ferrochelatase [Rikenellaceae bacterium]|nr:ferrochelatase [Rikenellaceae bacterium]
MRGLLLVNIGSPESPSRGDVAAYLRRFLSDRHVLRMPALLRLALVNLIIVPLRSSRSASVYGRLWDGDTFPLVRHANRLASKVSALMPEVNVKAAMRYGSPSIEQSINDMVNEGVTDISILPLYPHFAISTVTSAVSEAERVAAKHNSLTISTLPCFYDHPSYIGAMTSLITAHRHKQGSDGFLFSFHGLPLNHLPCSRECATRCNNSTWRGCVDTVRHNDCYRLQCFEGAALIAAKAQLTSYKVAFQSRMGRGEWLRPTLSQQLDDMRLDGVKSLHVIAPSFTADCMETLWELDTEAREAFEHSGGRMYYIPCLNDDTAWCQCVADMFAAHHHSTI